MAKTLREVGTYELVGRAPLQAGDGAHAVGLLGRVFLPVLLVKHRDRVGLSSAKTRCGKVLGALSATRSVVRQCEAGVRDGIACTRGVYMK